MFYIFISSLRVSIIVKYQNNTLFYVTFIMQKDLQIAHSHACQDKVVIAQIVWAFKNIKRLLMININESKMKNINKARSSTSCICIFCKYGIACNVFRISEFDLNPITLKIHDNHVFFIRAVFDYYFWSKHW